MKKQLTILLLIASSWATFAQDVSTTTDNKPSKYEIAVIPKFGFGKVTETGSPSTNGFFNGADLLFKFKTGERKNIGLSTGIGILSFTGNKTIGGNSVDMTNTYLHIPLTVNGSILLYKNAKPENQNIQFTWGLGFYGNDLMKQEMETLEGTFSDNNLGWNFGFTSQLGLKFVLSDLLDIGIGYEVQSDLSDAKKDGIERKIVNANTFNFGLNFKL